MSKITVIALRGSPNSGKTGTIVQAAKLFGKKRKIKSKSIDVPDMPKKDILEVFSIHSPKVKVGYASDSALPILDKEYWDELLKEKCSIIVCAVHIKDATAKALKKWGKKNKVQFIWIKQTKVDFYKGFGFTTFGYEEQNKTMAAFINWCVNFEIGHRGK